MRSWLLVEDLSLSCHTGDLYSKEYGFRIIVVA